MSLFEGVLIPISLSRLRSSRLSPLVLSNARLLDRSFGRDVRALGCSDDRARYLDTLATQLTTSRRVLRRALHLGLCDGDDDRAVLGSSVGFRAVRVRTRHSRISALLHGDDFREKRHGSVSERHVLDSKTRARAGVRAGRHSGGVRSSRRADVATPHRNPLEPRHERGTLERAGGSHSRLRSSSRGRKIASSCSANRPGHRVTESNGLDRRTRHR